MYQRFAQVQIVTVDQLVQIEKERVVTTEKKTGTIRKSKIRTQIRSLDNKLKHEN